MRAGKTFQKLSTYPTVFTGWPLVELFIFSIKFLKIKFLVRGMRKGKSQSSQLLKVVLSKTNRRVHKINNPSRYHAQTAYQSLLPPFSLMLKGKIILYS